LQFGAGLKIDIRNQWYVIVQTAESQSGSVRNFQLVHRSNYNCKIALYLKSELVVVAAAAERLGDHIVNLEIGHWPFGWGGIDSAFAFSAYLPVDWFCLTNLTP
jgi:hypothetical protein